MLRSRLRRVVAVLFPCLAASFTTAPPARAEGTFIAASNRFDMAHDVARNRIYISSGSQLLRHDVATKTALSPLEVGGVLGGMDISPDGNLLAVANRASSATAAVINVKLVNLATEVVTDLNIPRATNEHAAYSVAFDSNGKLMISALGTPSAVFNVPLRLHDLATGTTSVLTPSIATGPMITASGNRSAIGVTETKYVTGAWGRYVAGSEFFAKSATTTTNGSPGAAPGTAPAIVGSTNTNFEIGVNSGGSQFGFVTQKGTLFYNSSYQFTKLLGSNSSSDAAGGIAYHPTRDLVFLPWTTTSLVKVYNTTTFKQVGAYNFETTFPPAFNSLSFQTGRAKVSSDGSLLMCNVPDGVRYVSLADLDSTTRPLVASGENVDLNEDTSINVKLASTGGDPAIAPTYAFLTNPTLGAIDKASSSFWYIPRPNLNGLDKLTFQVTRGTETSTATIYLHVRPVDDAPVASPITTQTRVGQSVTITGAATDVDGTQTFGWRVSTAPSHGTATLAAGAMGQFIYTPQAGFTGIDTFQVIANDRTNNQGLNSQPATITVQVISDDTPVANNDSYTTSSQTSFSVAAPGLLANDTNTIGGALTCLPESPLTVTYGSVAVAANGSFTWTPPATTTTAPPSQISFRYRVSDSVGVSDYARVTINLQTPLTAYSQTVSVTEDVPKAITLSGAGPGTISYGIASSPARGTLSGTAPDLTYTPNPNYYGPDSFSFSVSSGNQSVIGSVTLNVAGVADLPIAYDQNLDTTRGTPVPIALRATDGDYNGFAWFIVAQPAQGTLSGTAPNLTYTPNADFIGTDSFTFKVNEGYYDSNVARVSIKVSAPTGGVPSAAPNSYRINRNSSLNVAAPGILANDSDPDGDSLRAVLQSPPSYASSFTLNPDGSFNWTGYSFAWLGYSYDSFTYRVSDGTQMSSPITVTIAINDAPSVSAGRIFFFTEDRAGQIRLAASDAQPNDVLTYTLVSQPQNGTLIGTAPYLTYIPKPNFPLTADVDYDSFTWSVSDGMATTGPVSYTLHVSQVNDAPNATAQSVSLDEDTSKSIVLRGNDIEGSNLTFSVVTAPTKGTLTGTAPNLTYTANPNAIGTDFFTFKANDGTLDSQLARVDISITSVPDAPVASAQTITLNEDTAKAIVLAGTDGDGETLSYEVVTSPIQGTLSGTAPNLTYTPGANLNGTDSFTFKVNDGTTDSAPATVAINIIAVNDAPTTSNASFTIAEGAAQAVTLAGNDVDGDPLTFAITKAPTKGQLSGTAPELTYTANNRTVGPDSFTFTVSDGKLSATGTVSITITSNNQAPSAEAQSISTEEDAPKALVLTGTDPEGDALSYAIVTGPTRGRLSGTAPNLTYSPHSNDNGTDSFTFTVSDGLATSAPATVSIAISPVNDAPSAISLSFKVPEDTTKAITLSGRDIDNPSPGAVNLTFTVESQPTKGTLSGTSPNLIYTPHANATGPDSFTYTSSDGELSSRVATVSIFLEPVNDAPTTTDQILETDENTAKEVVLTGADVDGNTLTFTVATQPAKGTLSGTAPNLTYTPNVGANGTDTFTFQVSDGTLTATGTVSITIKSVNDAPTAASQTVEADEDTAKEVVLSGADADGDTLTFVIGTKPAHGTLSGEVPNLTYTPAANYHGADSFTFTTSDGTLTSAPATVAITVTSSNDAPVASAQSLSTDEDTELTVTLSGSDADGDALTYTVATEPAHGVLNGTAPNLTYIPDADFSGTDSFTFKVSDGTATSQAATISISVAALSDTPVAVGDSYNATEDKTLTIAAPGVLANDTDPDGDTLTAVLTSNAANGNVSLNSNGSFTYTPDADFNGTDSFKYHVRDGAIDSTAVTVTIQVAAVNDAPVALAQGVQTNEDNPKTIVLSGADVDNEALNFTLVTQPTKGTLSGTAPNLVYTPQANVSGTDSFTFKVSDGTLDSQPATISIQVDSANDAPSAEAQNVSVLEDTAKAIVLAGSDPDGDALAYTVVTQPTKGTLSGTAPNLTYTPAANISGTDSFTFKVSDGTSSSATAVVSLTVTAVNDAPTASNSSVTTLEDTAKAIVLSASDIDSSTLTYSIATPPTKGTLSGTAPNLTYTPGANANGSDSFTWKASDGSLSATATVSVNITPVNDAPTADAQSVTTAQNTAKSITLSGGDVDGNTLTYTIVTNPTKGTLSGTGANRTYTPANNYNGTDSFTFRTSDGTLSSTTATVSITVTPPIVVPKVEVTYNITSQWAGGFTADVIIKNNGPAIKGWTLAWKFAGDQRITSLWRGTVSQSGQNVTVKDANYNKSIATGASETIGFQATFSGTNAKPTAFTLNGVATAVK